MSLFRFLILLIAMPEIAFASASTSKQIQAVSNLTTNGYVKTSGGVGTLGVQTSPIPSSDVGLLRTENSQSGTSYTFALTDGIASGGNPYVSFTNGSAVTATVPANGTTAFPVGDSIDICQIGAGTVTIAAAGGVTINSASGNLSIGGQYICVSLIKRATNTWLLIGNLAP